MRPVILLIFLHFSMRVFGAPAKICQQIMIVAQNAPKGRAEIYLVNRAGARLSGPVDFGDYRYETGKPIRAQTPYVLIISNADVTAENIDGTYFGNAVLVRSEPICKGLPAYDVFFQDKGPYTVDAADDFLRDLPLKIDAPFEAKFENLKIDGATDVYPVCRFDCRFVGRVISPKANVKP